MSRTGVLAGRRCARDAQRKLSARPAAALGGRRTIVSNHEKLNTKDICRFVLDASRSHRECARALCVSATTVAKYRNLMRLHRIDLEKLNGLSVVEVEEFVQARYKGGSRNFVVPDWSSLCRELDKPNVTAVLLFQEYVESNHSANAGANLLSESSFGRRLRAARKASRPSMRQIHPPGERSFVDFSGKHLYLSTPGVEQKKAVEVFVASLGASQLIFAVAVLSQKTPDWIEANVRALEFYGGAPLEIIPDNLKSAVTKPAAGGRPALINRTYLDFSEHYKVAIRPARRRRPQDKSLAEIGVRIVNMWIIAALRNRIFYSLDEINREIMRLVERINAKTIRRLKTSRRALFEEIEAPVLRPLPADRYEFVAWQDGLLVPKDYHLYWQGDHYSVPHEHIGQRVNLAASRSTVRIYSDASVGPIAVHRLGSGRGENITDPLHMPENHRAYLQSTPDDLRRWAVETGKEVERLFLAMEKNKRIKPFALLKHMSRAQKLAKEYGVERLVSACGYANSVGTQTIESVSNILRHDIDLRSKSRADRVVSKPVQHENVRGAASYDGVGHEQQHRRLPPCAAPWRHGRRVRTTADRTKLAGRPIRGSIGTSAESGDPAQTHS